MPPPAIFASAGLVPSSSGPLKRSSARASPTHARLKPRTGIPTLAANFRIRSSPRRRSAHHRLSRQTPPPSLGFSSPSCVLIVRGTANSGCAPFVDGGGLVYPVYPALRGELRRAPAFYCVSQAP